MSLRRSLRAYRRERRETSTHGLSLMFRSLVENLGARVIDEIVFSDHVEYTMETIQHILNRMEKAKVQICVTTEKDLVKVKGLWGNAESVWALSLGIKFLEGQDKLEKQLARV